MLEVPEYVAEGLTGIREGLHLRWNNKGKLIEKGSYDSNGKLKDPKYEPRWELWDTDPNGREYMVMQLQTPEGDFRHPGDWLIQHIQKLNPARYGGDVKKLMQAMLDDPEVLREVGTKKDSDDLIDAVGDWADWVATPKSGGLLTNRGQRIKST